MFTYNLSSNTKTPLYVQLYACIKKDIINGNLQQNEKLPSKRAAAKHLGVSVITVENAYGDLQSEGYIYSLPKKGFFVRAIPEIFVSQNVKDSAQSRFLVPQPSYRFDFSSNSIVSENFPFSIWAKLMRATFGRSQQSLMLPSPAGGVIELKQAICSHLKQFRGMDIQPEQVVIGAGTEYLYSLIVQLLGREKTFALPNPGYAKIAKIYRSIGVKCVFVDEDRFGMQTKMLAQTDADVAHISPSHHFPSGTVMSASRRHELLRLAAEKEDRYIIEDDYDSEFRLCGRPLPSLQSLDHAGSVIYVNTFSKSLAPTIRISYMVLPPALAKKFYDNLGFYSCTVSTFEQYTLAAFIEQGYFEKHINRMRNYYKKVREMIWSLLQQSPLADITEVSEEQAGLHFLLRVTTTESDARLKQRAKEQGVHIRFLSEYYQQNREQSEKHVIVMNYSAIKPEDIPAAIEALTKAILP